MWADVKQRIEGTAKLYNTIILFRDQGYFASVFRSVMGKCNDNIETWSEKTEVSGQGAVIVCSGNEIYAEEFRKVLVEQGWQNVFVPKDFGLTYSADKLGAIEFNLNIGCSLNCHYCPQGQLKKAYQKYGNNAKKRHLSFEDFKFIVDERMNPGASVSFSGMSEPFENKDFLKMLLYASENGNKVSLNTTLMGLTDEMFDEMVEKEVKIEACVLHIPDNKGNSHFRITKTYIGLLRKFIGHFGCSITRMSCHGDAPHEAVSDIVKNCGVEKILYEDVLGSRCGNLDSVIKEAPAPKKGRVICTQGKLAYPTPVCMPDGTLALCCNDYALDTEMGNILNEDWETIMLNKGFQKYLSAMNDESMEYLCRYCGFSMKRNDAIKEVYQDYLNCGENYYRVRAIFAKGRHEVVEKLQRAEHVCVFGLGKLFKDYYFQAGWNKVIRADLLSDDNEELWGKNYGGIPVISKRQLLAYEGLLVVIYAMECSAIVEDLQSIGIYNTLNILDIMEMFEGE